MIRSAPTFQVATRAIGIEHEDGVFGDAFDQEAKTLFAAAQVLFVGAPLRQVARDLGEPEQLTVGISHGRDDDVRPEQRAVLSDAPTLVLEDASLPATSSSCAGSPRCQRLRGIEAQKSAGR